MYPYIYIYGILHIPYIGIVEYEDIIGIVEYEDIIGIIERIGFFSGVQNRGQNHQNRGFSSK